jgi:hypothetical protein
VWVTFETAGQPLSAASWELSSPMRRLHTGFIWIWRTQLASGNSSTWACAQVWLRWNLDMMWNLAEVLAVPRRIRSTPTYVTEPRVHLQSSIHIRVQHPELSTGQRQREGQGMEEPRLCLCLS